MPSQLFTNDKVSFLACKPFTYRGQEYSIGDDFPQEEANNIETLVRARFVIPIVEDAADKPRHWHKHIRTREQAEEYLNRDRVQLRMPHEPDSDDVVNLDRLTHPETTPEPEELRQESEESEVPPPAEAAHADQYDPSYHTVAEVNTYLASVNGEERERVLQAERDGRNRKGIVEA